jgi:hypothetical protein
MPSESPFSHKTLRRQPIIKQERFNTSRTRPELSHQDGSEQLNLMGWVRKFPNARYAKGKPLFSQDTEKAANNQTGKVQHIQDLTRIEMYAELPHGPRTTCGLSKYLSHCPESTLEKFHEAIAHFANTGMEPKLADCMGQLNITCSVDTESKSKSLVDVEKLPMYPSILKRSLYFGTV